MFFFFFFNDTATTEIYTLSLHDALPISIIWRSRNGVPSINTAHRRRSPSGRSEEHTSELQSLAYLVCRLLLEKKKKKKMDEERLQKGRMTFCVRSSRLSVLTTHLWRRLT